MIQILKRNNTLEEFNKKKIIAAITKAACEVYGDNYGTPKYAETIANLIYGIGLESSEPLKVEDIQELVEDYLTDSDKLVAKTYIRYRYKRGVMRACSDEFIRSISEKLLAQDVQNSNANVDEKSFGGRVGEAANEMMKQYALDFCMSEMSRNNHLNNEIYIHKLNCA